MIFIWENGRRVEMRFGESLAPIKQHYATKPYTVRFTATEMLATGYSRDAIGAYKAQVLECLEQDVAAI